MKKFVAILAAVLLAILAVVPMACAAKADNSEYGTMYVSSSNGHGVRLRDMPNTEALILRNLGEGRPVSVVGPAAEGWYEVNVQVNGKTVNGYIMKKFLSTTNPLNLKQSFKELNSFQVKVVTASANGKVNLWPTASKVGDEIRTLTKTEKLTVLAESRAWYKVVDENGTEGYVAKAYVVKC